MIGQQAREKEQDLKPTGGLWSHLWSSGINKKGQRPIGRFVSSPHVNQMSLKLPLDETLSRLSH